MEERVNVAQMMNLVFEEAENIVGKEENAGYQQLSFSNHVFKRLPLQSP